MVEQEHQIILQEQLLHTLAVVAVEVYQVLDLEDLAVVDLVVIQVHLELLVQQILVAVEVLEDHLV
jgi:hypothetical protein|tara:strand:+ start:245 stop:442 length:198 start_codon:yes stop_codon:yes gene_type:complete